jgi:glycine betaine/proline transport system substrate-binding protein
MKMSRKLKQWGLSLALLTVIAMMVPGTVLAARKHVVIGGMSWAGSNAIEQIMKYVLEEKLDTRVKITPISASLCWPALEKGSVDVFPDMWMPNQQAGFDKYVTERKSVAVKLSYDKAVQGFYMPAALAKANGIKSIFDLKGKEAMFDTNGDGQGEIWVGPFDWEASEINASKVKEYGLDIEPVKVQQWLFLAMMKEAMRKDKPIIFYYWEPEWPMAKYDLVRLEEPPNDESCWQHVKGDSKATKISCAFPDASVYVGVSKKLEKRNPNAFKFLMNFHIPIEEVSNLISAVEDVPGNPKKPADEVAKAWVESHPEIVKEWLSGVQ